MSKDINAWCWGAEISNNKKCMKQEGCKHYIAFTYSQTSFNIISGYADQPLGKALISWLKSSQGPKVIIKSMLYISWHIPRVYKAQRVVMSLSPRWKYVIEFEKPAFNFLLLFETIKDTQGLHEIMQNIVLFCKQI